MGPRYIFEYAAALMNFRNPGSLVLERLGIQSLPYRIKTRTGIELIMRPDRIGDRYTCFETFGIGVYETALDSLGVGDVVIDVGANIGCFALAAWRVVGGKGTVLALEPEAGSFPDLTRT